MHRAKWILVATLLSGCSGLSGPPPVLNAYGPYDERAEHDRRHADGSSGGPRAPDGFLKRFIDAARKASELDYEALPGRRYVTRRTAAEVRAAGPGTAAAALKIAEARQDLDDLAIEQGEANQRMLDSGFTLVYAHCNDFFLHSGRNQTRLMTTRDAIASFGTLATGILALVDFKSASTRDNALAVVGLGTSATFAGVDIVTQRFLFGAENVDAVRELTLSALDAHQTTVRNQGAPTYDRVVKSLLDDQAICTPRRIALLARNAIEEGEIKASSTTGNADLSQEADRQVFRNIARDLGSSGTLTEAQEVGLWWLFEDGATGDSEMAAVKAKLAGLPKSSNPFKLDGVYDPAWPLGGTVRGHLQRLSVGTRARLEAAVKREREALAAEGEAIPATGVDSAAGEPREPQPQQPSEDAVNSVSSLLRTTPVQDPGRVSVGIKPKDGEDPAAPPPPR